MVGVDGVDLGALFAQTSASSTSPTFMSMAAEDVVTSASGSPTYMRVSANGLVSSCLSKTALT